MEVRNARARVVYAVVRNKVGARVRGRVRGEREEQDADVPVGGVFREEERVCARAEGEGIPQDGLARGPVLLEVLDVNLRIGTQGLRF